MVDSFYFFEYFGDGEIVHFQDYAVIATTRELAVAPANAKGVKPVNRLCKCEAKDSYDWLLRAKREGNVGVAVVLTGKVVGGSIKTALLDMKEMLATKDEMILPRLLSDLRVSAPEGQHKHSGV